MIWVYASGLCIAFSLCVALTPFVRRVAFKVGAVDVPDARRKIHTETTAALGGIAVAGAFFVTLPMLRLLFPSIETLALWRLALPCAAILALGAWDDIHPIKPRFKLFLQCVAAACFYAAGFRLDRVFGTDLSPWLSFAATIMWLVACANAMNLFDGMDGLAAGLSMFVSFTLLALAGYQGKVEVAVVSAVLAGASLGFLLYNFPPAVIFLGDTGSLFLGMTLGVLAIEGSFKSHLAFALIVPFIALGLPLMDAVLAVMRRVSRRVSVFTPDREHIHHRLVALGFTRRQALVLLYGLSVILASVSLLIAFSGSIWAGGLIVLAGISIAALVRLLGASELREFGFFILGGLGRRRALARHRRVLKRGERLLQNASNIREVTAQALLDLRNLGFDRVMIRWQDDTFSEGSMPPREEAMDTWQWDTRLFAGGVAEGTLTLVKHGGPQTIPPEIPLLIQKYAEALADALARMSAEADRERAP